MEKSNYGALRLTYETLDTVRDLQEAYEKTTGQRVTMDNLVNMLVGNVQTVSPNVWKVYQLIRSQKQAVKELVDGKED